MLKSLIVIASLTAAPALADGDFCAHVGTLSEYSMNARLSGIPFSVTFNQLKADITNFEEQLLALHELLQIPQDQRWGAEQIAFKLATDIYETPRPDNDANPRIVALEYRSKIEIACYRDLGNAAVR